MFNRTQRFSKWLYSRIRGMRFEFDYLRGISDLTKRTLLTYGVGVRYLSNDTLRFSKQGSLWIDDKEGTSFDLGKQDFEIAMEVRFNSFTSYRGMTMAPLFFKGDGYGSSLKNSFEWAYLKSYTRFQFIGNYQSNGTLYSNRIIESGTVDLRTSVWYRLKVTRVGRTITFYVNDKVVGTNTLDEAINDVNVRDLRIGERYHSATNYYAYLDATVRNTSLQIF